jgi:hypothetical protein
VRFSEPQGRALLRLADRFGLPVWSFDQWLDFWSTRDTWRMRELSWNDTELAFTAEGAEGVDGLSLLLPAEFDGRRLADVTRDDERCRTSRELRYDATWTALRIPPSRSTIRVRALYR